MEDEVMNKHGSFSYRSVNSSLELLNSNQAPSKLIARAFRRPGVKIGFRCYLRPPPPPPPPPPPRAPPPIDPPPPENPREPPLPPPEDPLMEEPPELPPPEKFLGEVGAE